MPDFWKTAGFQLVERDERGWLNVTPEYLRAYLQRPEIRPIENSCPEEIRLFDDLLQDPLLSVRQERLEGLADQDAADNYRILLDFRMKLQQSGTIEGAYMRLMQTGDANIPPLFLEQMAHLITRNILSDCTNPMQLRAAEIFFRVQAVNAAEGKLLLADEEVVSLYEENQKHDGEISLAQLVEQASGVSTSHQLNVLNENNKEIYWERSDRFDTAIDFRFMQPALDGFARTIEAWLKHFLHLEVRVQPMQKIEDLREHWHIGLDRDATAILSALYRGEDIGEEPLKQIIALFNMTIQDEAMILPEYRGRPLYLGLAMSDAKRVRMKPQNLLTNLPLVSAT